jgi:hypothetical protein
MSFLQGLPHEIFIVQKHGAKVGKLGKSGIKVWGNAGMGVSFSGIRHVKD